METRNKYNKYVKNLKCFIMELKIKIKMLDLLGLSIKYELYFFYLFQNEKNECEKIKKKNKIINKKSRKKNRL